MLLLISLILLLTFQLMNKQQSSSSQPVRKEHFVITEADINLGSFLDVEYNAPSDHDKLTFVDLEVEASDNLFERIVRTKPVQMTPDQIAKKFRQCMDNKQDTIKGCLTYARVGLEPYMCKKLAAEYYGEISNYTGLLCNQLMNQQRTSCSAGPC